MSARLLNGTTRLTIVGLITALACGGIWLAHRGLFAALERDKVGFAGRIVLAGLMGAAAYAIGRFRNDLVDE